MCGIAGLFDRTLRAAGDDLRHQGNLMGTALAHRGPDGEGLWSDAAAGVALVHRRLSVVELSSLGAQPMLSTDARWVITYNGELYNTGDLRYLLAQHGATFRGSSDTEVLIEAVRQWGLERAISAANGMFAAAVYDRHEQTLHLVRDRLGIKPLCWTSSGDRILFASELAAIGAVCDPTPAIDPVGVRSLLSLGYIAAPHSIWMGIRKVQPGTIVSLAPGKAPRVVEYWSLAAVAESGLSSPLSLTDDEAADALTQLLSDAVRRQLVSDVPLGGFLSGGIDSTAVAALMQAATPGRVRTFTIGFTDRQLDETRHAAAVARHLGTDHTEVMVADAEAIATVPRLADIYDEPFADSSQIPTAILSALTRKYVTVALSGDGGDEVFAGYNRHRFAAGPGRWIERFPHPLRQWGAALLAGRAIGGMATAASRLSPRYVPSQPDDKLRKLANAIRHDERTAYRLMIGQDYARELADTDDLLSPAFAPRSLGERMGPLERMQYCDTLGYLPNDILTKVDRASMAVALEVRVPMLDHRVVEFAWRLPTRMRVRNGETKWLLRRVLDRFVPRPLVDRPKQGFAVPLAAWLRGPLREWADALLTSPRLGEGVFEPGVPRALWREHLSGSNRAYAIWPYLMLYAWQERAASASFRKNGLAVRGARR